MDDVPTFSNEVRPRSTNAQSQTAVVNGLRLHYLDHGGRGGPLVFLHGLSANAHSFDEIIGAGLAPRYRALALDLRGRGHSDKTAPGYSLEEHASDVIAWLDALGLSEVVLVGHSFGGFLAAYIASRHPSRVRTLVLMDISASAPRDPRVAELLRPSLGRLMRSWGSREEYIAEMKTAPYLGPWWDASIERYFQTDAEAGEDGQVRSLSHLPAVAESAKDGAKLDWPDILRQVKQPTLLLYAVERFGPEGATALVLPEDAIATAAAIPNGRCLPVPGNHITMLFGNGALASASAIAAFVHGEEPTSQVDVTGP
jgi:pimeloyl-ACP methyl ester carboxylesterase